MTNNAATRKSICVSLGAVLISALAAMTTATPAGARDSDETPLHTLDSFAFSSEVSIASGAGGNPTFSIVTTGTFVAPSSQDCRARVTVGGAKINARLLVVGQKYFLDQGDGLERVGKSEADSFASLCPSDPSFWNGMPSFPRGFHGPTEMHNGVKSEHLDLTDAVGALSGYLDGFPADVTLESLDLYLATKGAWPVALELRLTGASDESCQSFGTEEAGLDLSAPCSLTRDFELSRPNAHSNEVKLPKSVITQSA